MGVRRQAIGDLFARYREAFFVAWQHRKMMDAPARLPHEAAFLPATLALQETPVHPAPRIALWLIMVFALLALLWSLLGQIDVVATASGKVVPDSRSKLIQSPETAVIRAIHVRDGQSVREGEILIELDSTITGADIQRLQHELLSAQLDAARYKALLKVQAPDREPALTEIPVHLEPARRIAEEQWIMGQYAAHQSLIAQLDAVIARRQAEARATKALVVKLEQVLPITRQREADYRGLLDKNHVARHQYLELKSYLIEQENDLLAQQEKLAEIEASRLEAERQKQLAVAESRREWLQKLNDAERHVASLTQETIKAESRGSLMSLAAPVDGVVQQLAVHTLGGVVTPAQALMVIVPQDSPVEVEALLPNKDIGFVYPGQVVEVKFETFSFTKYGTITGKVASVSQDAIQDEKLGLVFAVKVKLDSESIFVENRDVRLSPGMAVTVEIKTHQRRLIEYFLSPLLRYADESLRER